MMQRNALSVMVPSVFAAAFLTAGGAPAWAQVAGPGPHWVHLPPVPPGSYTLPGTTAAFGFDLNLDPNCLADFTQNFAGPALVGHSGSMDDSINFPGTRPVDGHLDVIDTEIVSMSLTGGGMTLTVGAGLGSPFPLAPSRGAIAEQPGNPLLADSFFDVFFEIDFGGGTRVYNQQPLIISAVLDRLPLVLTFQSNQPCLPLYTSPIPGMGIHVANLEFVPAPGAAILLGLGGLVAARRRR